MPYSLNAEETKLWLPLTVWSAAGGWIEDAPDCYFSDLYKARPRNPKSTAMASYTAAIFCPDAPIDPMIPAARGGTSKADLEASRTSLAGQVHRGQKLMQRVQQLDIT